MRYLILLGCLTFLYSCDTELAPPGKEKKMIASDFRIFFDTPIWELAQAVYKEDKELIKKIILEQKVDINFQEPKYGETILMLAIYHGKYEISKLLLDLGADPNIHDTFKGNSAIIDAVDNCVLELSNDTKLVKLLLSYKANVNDIQTKEIAKNRAGSVLSKAASGSINLVKLLVEAGADVNFPNTYGNSPLFEAAAQGRYDIVLYLLENGAEPERVLVIRKPQGIEMRLIDLLKEDEAEGDIPFLYKNNAQKVKKWLADKGIN
jgi:uncharacterized protein